MWGTKTPHNDVGKKSMPLASGAQVKTSNKHQALFAQVVSASTKTSLCPALPKRLSKTLCSSFAEEKRVPDLTVPLLLYLGGNGY